MRHTVRVEITPLPIDGAYVVQPDIHHDERGDFLEWCRTDLLAQTLGRPVPVAQGNLSTSARGVMRGIHFSTVPPGQAKYVTCVTGAVHDVVVDLRVGSPTFGQSAGVDLDASNRRAVFIEEGLGHGFLSLDEGSTVLYLCSTAYEPAHDRAINPLDPELGIDWPHPPGVEPVLSPKDRAAPSLLEAMEMDMLPTMEQVRARHADQG